MSNAAKKVVKVTLPREGEIAAKVRSKDGDIAIDVPVGHVIRRLTADSRLQGQELYFEAEQDGSIVELGDQVIPKKPW